MQGYPGYNRLTRHLSRRCLKQSTSVNQGSKTLKKYLQTCISPRCWTRKAGEKQTYKGDTGLDCNYRGPLSISIRNPGKEHDAYGLNKMTWWTFRSSRSGKGWTAKTYGGALYNPNQLTKQFQKRTNHKPAVTMQSHSSPFPAKSMW